MRRERALVRWDQEGERASGHVMRVPPDIRPGNPRLSRTRAYLRLLRTPKQNTWYGDLDPRSWRVALHQIRSLKMGRTDLQRTAHIIREGRAEGRYLCSMPRSGTNWVFAMLQCGLSISRGGTGTFDIVPDMGIAGDDEWVFEGDRFGWPTQPQSLGLAVTRYRAHAIGDPVFTYSHEPLDTGLIDYRRCRPVVTVREPLAAARSQVHKDGIDWYRAGPKRLGVSVDRFPFFFSIWEKRLQDPEVAARTLVLRYEDMRADPVAALVQISRHWDLDVDEATWAVAAERCSWEAMAEMAADLPDTARISVNRGALPDDMDAEIRERVAGAGASFGYGDAADADAEAP